MDAKQIWRQAQDENTPPEILAELAKSKDKEILRLVAGNPNTPAEILEKLSVEFADTVVANPIFDLLLLENPESKFVLLSLARASTTSVEKLAELANYSDRDIREAVVINNKTPVDIVNSIFNKDISIKESVAKNPNASEKLLCSLAKDNNYNVLYAIAQRKCLSEKIVKILIQCDCRANKFYPNHRPENYSWRIRQELASNLDIRRNIINKFIKDEHHHVRAAIAKRKDILEKQAVILAYDTSCFVRDKLANNPNISNHVIKLLNIFNKDWESQVYINKTTDINLRSAEREGLLLNTFSEESVKQILLKRSIYIKRLLASNPKLSINSIKEIKEDFNSCTLLGLTHNINTSSKVLSELATNANYLVRQKIAEHSQTTVEILDKLKTDKNITVREKVAQSPKISAEIIEELARDSNPLIRRAIASNTQTPANILDKLKSDRSLSVRLAVVENTNTSIDTLKELLNDEAAKIIATAKLNLRKTQKN